MKTEVVMLYQKHHLFFGLWTKFYNQHLLMTISVSEFHKKKLSSRPYLWRRGIEKKVGRTNSVSIPNILKMDDVIGIKASRDGWCYVKRN